jgi:hypothetical protein
MFGDGVLPPSDKSAPLAPFGRPPLIDGEDAQGAITDRYERRALSRRKFAGAGCASPRGGDRRGCTRKSAAGHGGPLILAERTQ